MFPTVGLRRLFLVWSAVLVACGAIAVIDSASGTEEKLQGQDGAVRVSNYTHIHVRSPRMFYPGPVGSGSTLNCYYCNIFMGGTGGWTKPPSGGGGGGGWSPGPTAEILNGRPARPNEFPYVVAVIKTRANGELEICGGAIHDASHIITAAHCFFDPDPATSKKVYISSPSQIVIVAGTLDWNNEDRTGVVIAASDVCSHKYYNQDDYREGHDIAIIKLSTKLDLRKNRSVIREANFLWKQSREYGKMATSAGWGYVLNSYGNDTAGAARYLQTAQLNVYNPSVHCAGFRGEGSDIMCAGTAKADIPPPPAKPTGNCFGDSGSPLGCTVGGKKYEACSLVSYVDLSAYNCQTVNTNGFVTIFTKNAPFKTWVDAYVRGNRRHCYNPSRRELSTPDY